MKKLILLISMVATSAIAYAQTATNFTCNDCSGVSHDLFTELDAGKIIVLDWVMPCGACAGPSLTAYNVVGSFQSSHPGSVFLYMADDFANTVCSSLNGWANSIGVPQNAYSLRFSNPAIDMLDYGSIGMPKIVVVGGGVNHTVFYNSNNTVNASALQAAINLALTSTGINEQNNPLSILNIYPNPADKSAEIKFVLNQPATVTIELFNLQGKRLQDIFSGPMIAGENKVEVNTAKLAAATYLVKLTGDGKTRFINLLVSH